MTTQRFQKSICLLPAIPITKCGSACRTLCSQQIQHCGMTSSAAHQSCTREGFGAGCRSPFHTATKPNKPSKMHCRWRDPLGQGLAGSCSYPARRANGATTNGSVRQSSGCDIWSLGSALPWPYFVGPSFSLFLIPQVATWASDGVRQDCWINLRGAE